MLNDFLGTKMLTTIQHLVPLQEWRLFVQFWVSPYNEKMHFAQFDVLTAFLYGGLEETIYLEQPKECDMELKE